MKINYTLDSKKNKADRGSAANSLKDPSIKTVNGELTDAGIDLFAQYDFYVKPGEVVVADTYTIFELPRGTFGLIFPRGGDTFIVGSGVIDPGYRGTVKVRIANTTKDSMFFGYGSSIGQMILLPNWFMVTMVDKAEEPELVKVTEKEINKETERGEDGRINKKESGKD